MEAAPIVTRIFTAHEATHLFKHLDQLEVEYHKPYLRFNKPVKVPRGQASFTLDESIHYSYKAAGGSPPNRVMDVPSRGETGVADRLEAWQPLGARDGLGGVAVHETTFHPIVTLGE